MQSAMQPPKRRPAAPHPDMGDGSKGHPLATPQPSLSGYILLGAMAFGIIKAFPLLSPILLSLILVLLISLAVNPLVVRMRSFMGGRKIPAMLMALAVLVVLGLAGLAFFGPMRSSVGNLSKQLPEYWAKVQKPFVKLEQQAARTEEKLQAEVAIETAETNHIASQTNSGVSSTNVSNLASARKGAETNKVVVKATPLPPEATPSKSSRPHSSLTQMLQGVAGFFSGVAFNAAQVLIVLITVFFGVTFTLMQPRPIFGAIFGMIPEQHHARALKIVRRIGEFLPNWALSTLLAMLTVGLLVGLLMWPLLGLSNALVLGLIAGVFEAIPYLGPILSAIPALLVSLGKEGGGLTPMWVLLAYLAVQLLENNVIAPLILARGMKLHSVAVIFSMLLCVAAFGILGVLVAAPLVAIAMILHEEIYRKRYLPDVTDAELDRLARNALGEKAAVTK